MSRLAGSDGFFTANEQREKQNSSDHCFACTLRRRYSPCMRVYLSLIAIPSLFSNDNNNNNNNSNDDKTIERRESKGFDRVSIRTRKRSGFFPAPIVLACSLFLPFVGGETRVRYARKPCWCSLLFRQSVKTAACQQQPPVLTSRPFRSLGHVRPLSTEEKML